MYNVLRLKNSCETAQAEHSRTAAEQQQIAPESPQPGEDPSMERSKSRCYLRCRRCLQPSASCCTVQLSSDGWCAASSE